MYGWVPETITTLFLIINLFIFTWRVTALQYCVGFCHTSKWIIGIYMFPPSWTPLPAPAPSHPSWLSQSTRLVLPASHSRLCLADWQVSRLFSQCAPPPPSPAAPTSLLSTPASPLLPCRQIYQDHVSRSRQSLLVAQMVKNLPAMKGTRVQSLGQEEPLEMRIATHSSILAWRIPWTEELGRL